MTIYPYSSYSLNVYAFDDNPVTVTATAGTDTATITFNDPAVKAASRPERLRLRAEHGEPRVGVGAERVGAQRLRPQRFSAERLGTQRLRPELPACRRTRSPARPSTT